MPSRPRRRGPTNRTGPTKPSAPAPPRRPADPLVGRKLAGYEIISRLRSEHPCVVYKARQPAMGREVAMRVLRRDADQRTIESFYRTARRAAQVHHANIAGIYDVSAAAGLHLCTLELVEGRTLGDLLRSRERIPSADAVRVAIGLAEAFAQVKARGPKGWRLQPDLVVLTPRGELKLLPPTLASDDERSLTTPYILRSIGVLLYAMLTGGRAPDLEAALDPGSDLPGQLPPLKSVALGTRRDVAALVGRLLGAEGEPFPTIEAAAAALREVLAAREQAEERARTATERARERQRRQKRGLLVAAAIGSAVLVALLALLVLYLRSQSGAEKEFTQANAAAQRSLEAFKQARAAFVKNPTEAAAQAARAHLENARALYAAFCRKHPRHSRGILARNNASQLEATLREFDTEVKAYVRYAHGLRKLKALDEAFGREVAALLETGGTLNLQRWMPRYQALLDEFKDSRLLYGRLVHRIETLPRLVQRKQMEIDTNKLCRDFQTKFRPQHLYKQALAAWDAYRTKYESVDFLRDAAVKNHEAQTNMIKRDAREQYARLVNQAQHLARQGKTAQARKICQKIINDFGVPSLVQKAKELMAKLPPG